MPNAIGSRTLTVLAITALAGSAANAQNALGDGRLLDNNLSPNSPYNASRQDFGNELRFRNAIATGNAPGGLSFRGDVGYSAPYEFRGELGSDSLYSFRRDSVYSGLAGMGIRGTEAVQYQFALTTGARLPQNVVGSLVVPRDPASSAVARAGGVLDQRPQFGSVLQRPGQEINYNADGTIDATSFDRGAVNQLRSTSAYTANRGFAPFLLTTMGQPGADDEVAVTATPLRGLKAQSMYDPSVDLKRDNAAETRPEGSLRADPAVDRPENQNQSTRLEVEQPVTAYREVIKRLEARAAAQGLDQPSDTTPEIPEWQQRIQDLRTQLVQPPTRPTDEGAEEGADEPSIRNIPGSDVDLPREIDVPNPRKEEEPEDRRAVDVTFDAQTMRLIRESGGDVSHLVDPDADSVDPYVLHLREGERLLGSGSYFDAEERFTRALSVRPGDVTAQIGRVHAQLGAGMFLSSALNLRTAMVMAPTVITTRYADNLLPGKQRLEAIERALRENVGLIERPGGRLALDPMVERDSALLLAYLGYQRGDAETVRVGLNEFRARVAPTAERPGTTVDFRLAKLLERVWVLGEPAPGADGE
ncbi:MAG: hypothetical protein RIB60_07230 [Phycisphaerales bacterium]